MIDIGVNLASGRFRKDREAVLERAWQAGLEAMVLTGTDPGASREAVELTGLASGRLYATAGMHPHQAKHWDGAAAEAIAALAERPEVVALGECGLDFNRDFSPREDQRRCFEAQLELAAEWQLPVFLHQRDAHDAFLPLLKRYRDRLPAVVVHCFTGSERELDDYLALDCHIGVTGWICDTRRGAELRELVRRIPGERLMVETDAPYLTPHNLPEKPRGNRNEPAFLPAVLEVLAECRGEPLESLARRSAHNARAFFQLGS